MRKNDNAFFVIFCENKKIFGITPKIFAFHGSSKDAAPYYLVLTKSLHLAKPSPSRGRWHLRSLAEQMTDEDAALHKLIFCSYRREIRAHARPTGFDCGLRPPLKMTAEVVLCRFRGRPQGSPAYARSPSAHPFNIPSCKRRGLWYNISVNTRRGIARKGQNHVRYFNNR